MGDPATFRGSALGGNHLTDHRRGIRHWITSFLRREDRAGPCPAAGIGPPLPFPGPDHRQCCRRWALCGARSGCHVAKLPSGSAPVHIRAVLEPRPRVPRGGLTSALPAVLIPPVAARIEVSPESDTEFRVTVTEGAGRTVHRVTVAAPYYEKLTGGRVAAKELVRLSFEFLLEREPKESILQAFDLPVIGRYFPKFEREVRRRVDSRRSG